MWGFYNNRDRPLARQFYNNIVDPIISKGFKLKDLKGQDQRFLNIYVYNNLKKNSIIHDSYTCGMYRDGEPFPTRRKGACFVGGANQISCLNETMRRECPTDCRPKDHQDWKTC